MKQPKKVNIEPEKASGESRVVPERMDEPVRR